MKRLLNAIVVFIEECCAERSGAAGDQREPAYAPVRPGSTVLLNNPPILIGGLKLTQALKMTS
ncbi:hypothetical protein DDV21_001100 [Streptococcus chenjunshii]|uniref:Uncharacterized protein n=1 Tax=Streptococcus chenjunshii TaxID=2173853 RepID=A0A372KMB2_9STRE|nr:hypothetical protein DDV21_001100 [Streptococcus chenjunshii]RFU50490.1 hypothetical protein DDV22_08435 [Streptococcus chenjunshii]RFU52718.1 hypothetical protein DDV23_08275 [Streptococcus chenjunshii]